MAGCEYQIEGSDKIYSESEFKKLLSEGYLDKVMMDKGIKIKGIKADEALASSFQIPSAIQPQAPTEVKSDYQIAQEATNEVSKENPDASVLLTPKGEDLSLTAVYVAKENRGKGIGTKVLESVKKQADKLGKKVVLDATTELDEETDLGRLESFYEKNGFTKVGDNKFEYNPTAEITETVTPEVKEEIGASKKIEELLPKPEKPIDKTKKGIFGKKDRTYKKRLFQYEDDLDDWNKSIKFFNNNPDAVEFYENANEEQKKYILRYSIWKSNSKDLDLNQLSEYRFIQDDGTFLISSKGFTMKINDYENAPKLKDGKLDFDKVKYDVVNPKGEVIYSSSNYDDAVSSLYEENSKYQLQKSKVSIPTETVTKTEEKVTEPTVESLRDVQSTTKALENSINKQGGYKSYLSSEKFYSIFRKIGLAWHGGENVIKSFDKSKIKGGSRGELGYGYYFSENSKSFDYGKKITFIDTSKLNLLDGDKPISKDLLYQIENYSSDVKNIEKSILKLEEELYKTRNIREYNEIEDQIKNLKNKLNESKKSPNASLDSYVNRLVNYINKNPNTPIRDFAAGEIETKPEMRDAFERLMSEIGYDGIQVSNKWQFSLFPYNENKLNEKIINNPSEYASRLYHKAKQDGSNPELVKSVEELLGKKEPTAEATPETKQPTREAVAAKNLADYLRTGKMEKGTAMVLPLPGFDKLWNGTIETVAKAIEVGGVTAGNLRQSVEAGMKALKQTDAYKAITDPKERAKISREYKKQLLEKIPQFYNIDTDNLREAEFNDFNQKLEESKDKTLSTKEFNAIKSEAKKFVNDNLPADKYRKSEVQSYVRNNFDKAKTVEDIQKNLDKVNNIMATKEAKIQKETEKQAAKDRTSLIKNIESKIAANSKKVVSKNRRTGAKKGKITIESQQQINQIIQDLKDQGLFKNLDMLSDTELNDLNNTIDNILETGRVEQKQLEAVNDAKKRADKAIIFQALAGDSDDVLNGKEQVQERFKEANGYVIVDKQLMSSSDFKSYINKNPDTDLTDVPFYYKSESIDKVKQRLEKDSGILKAAKDGTLFNIVDLETHIKNLGAKSPELKKWLEDNIGNPIREAKRKEVESLWRETKQYKKDINKIFGTYSVKTKEFYRNKWRTKTVNIPKVYDTLVAPSDITPKNSDESLLAGEVVTLYMIVYNTNPEIKDKYKLDPKEAEKDMKTLMRENYVDPQKIYDFMHKPENKSLLDFAHFLSKKYNEDARAMFGPTIEQFHQIALGNTYYHPKIRSSSTLEPESIMNLEQDKSLSVTSPNMRHRTDNASAPFKIISAHELYLNYLKSMTHAKEYIPVVKAAQTLLTDVNKPYIMEKLGSVSDYNDMVKALSIAITDKSPFESGPMSALTNWTALTMLWFRIKSIPQQASSLVHYYTSGIKDGVMPWDILRAVPTTKEEREFSAKFYSDNPYLWTRLSGGNITPEMQKLKEQTDSLSNSLIKGTLSLARFTGLIGIKFGDFAAAATPGGGMSFALAQFKKKFKETGDYQSSRDFAIQRWMEETERTGQVSLAREIMSTQSFNTLVRLFIPFSSAQQGMGKKAYKAYLDIKDSENLTNKEYAQAIADLIYFPLLAPLPFLLTGNAGAALFRMFFDDEEDETLEDAQKKRIYHDLIFDAAQSNATALGLPGLLLNVTMNIARDRAGFNQSPSYQRLTDIGTELVSLLSSNKKWEDLSVSERKQFTKDYISENGSLKGKNIKDIYDDSIVSEKQINLLLKSIGAKNIKDLIESIKKLSKDKDFWAFFLDLETKDDKINKKLDPYFNQAVKNNKKDELYEFLSRLQRYFEDEDYKIEEYIPKEGIKTKSKRTSKFSSPKIQKPKISRPKMPKF